MWTCIYIVFSLFENKILSKRNNNNVNTHIRDVIQTFVDTSIFYKCRRSVVPKVSFVNYFILEMNLKKELKIVVNNVESCANGCWKAF